MNGEKSWHSKPIDADRTVWLEQNPEKQPGHFIVHTGMHFPSAQSLASAAWLALPAVMIDWARAGVLLEPCERCFAPDPPSAETPCWYDTETRTVHLADLAGVTRRPIPPAHLIATRLAGCRITGVPVPRYDMLHPETNSLCVECFG